MMSATFANVPQDLKTLPQWVLWRGDKVPYTASGRMASYTNPKTWTSFEAALAAYGGGSFRGLGFVVSAEDPFCGIDLDHCLDPKTGGITSRVAEDLLRRFDSYTEVTPSGDGLRIWIRARKTGGRCKKVDLEVYDRSRYFTVTGRLLSGSRETIEARQDELDALIAEEFPEPKAQTRQRRPYDGPPGERIDLEEFLLASGVPVRGEVADGTARRVFRIICPWSHEHTGGDTSGTRVGQYADGATWFICEHAHCANRRWAEFRSEVSPRPSAGRGKVYARRRGTVSIG